MIPTEYYLEEMERVLVGRDQARTERDAARARVAELEGAGRELVDTIDRADYGDVSRAIGYAADHFRAVLNAVPAADEPRTDRN
jgi:hypothetical protein